LGFTVPDAIIPGIVIWAVVRLLGLSGSNPIAIALVALVLAGLVLGAAYYFYNRSRRAARPVEAHGHR
jgi:hypothetical protein